MGKYIARKVLVSIPILLGVLTTVFLFIRLVPGDPAQAILGEYASKDSLADMRHQLGLDAPLYQQYLRFMGNAVQGNFGRSIQTKQLVMTRITDAFPFTFQLAVGAVIVAVVLGVPLGVISAVRRGSAADYLSTVLGLLGISMPSFWVGILLLILFSVKLNWLPITGAGKSTGVLETLKYLVLPAITLGAAEAGLLMRMTRSTLMEVLNRDFIRTARAKGLSERRVVYGHGLRNAMIPVVTILGLNIGRLLGGTVVVETLFVRPGLGQVLVSAMSARDYPQVQGIVAFFAVLIIALNLAVDLIYGWLDPRIHYQ